MGVLTLYNGRVVEVPAVGIASDLLTPFAKLKVANSYTIFESVFNYDKQPLVWDEALVTGGTNTWNTNTNAINLVTTTASGSSVIVQSRRRIKYNPGRSTIVQISTNIGGNKANCRRRVGQFDSNNGVFFELDGTVLKCVIRSNTSGSVVDTSVSQSSFNGDKLDGTGPSGVTLDTSKHQLWIMEYGWQGIAIVRFGLYLNGSIVYCHTFNSANEIAVPYMKTANLPLRVENTNTGITASATTLSSNCFCLQQEGEDDDAEGFTRSYVRTSLKTVAAVPGSTPVISFKLSSTKLEAIANLVKAVVSVQTNDNVFWEILLNPTLTGATYSETLGYLDIDTDATSLTGGIKILAGVINQNQSSGSESTELLKNINTVLGSDLAGNSDVVTIAASSRATNADVVASFTWREF